VKRDASARGAVIMGAAALLLASACATAAPDGSFPVQKALIGKTESEMLACAGEPKARSVSGGETTLVYRRTAPVFEESFAVTKSSVPCPRHACEAAVRLKDGRVADVQYRPTPHSLGGCEHCEEMFRRCLP
jgi:hypothetical protein